MTVGLHQGSTLNSYMFTLLMNELSNHIQYDVLWCMLFANDIILANETSKRVNQKFQVMKDS